MIFIYQIVNLRNQKCYVGKTRVDVNMRFRQHAVADSVIGRAIRNDGAENFIVNILEVVSDDAANQRELFWIDKLDCLIPNGYNVARRSVGRPKK